MFDLDDLKSSPLRINLFIEDKRTVPDAYDSLLYLGSALGDVDIASIFKAFENSYSGLAPLNGQYHHDIQLGVKWVT